MARFVAHCKYLDQLKQNDDLCSQSFKNAKYVVYADGKPLLKFAQTPPIASIHYTNFNDMLPLCGEDFQSRATLLGIEEDSEEHTSLFACSTTTTMELPAASELLPTECKFSEIRLAILNLPAKDAGIVTKGYSMLNWLASTKFCHTCASPLTRNVSGTMLKCETCTKRNHHYPITHPVVMTLVEDPTGEKVLLVRQPRYAPGMYSCIAGFLESGESLEDAVRREVAEEAGIVVGKVNFFDSQTWPLPQNSLMLGCTTRAMPDSITLDLDHTELEDGSWFTKAEVKEAYDRIVKNPKLVFKNDGQELLIAPSVSIGHHLLKNWLGL